MGLHVAGWEAVPAPACPRTNCCTCCCAAVSHLVALPRFSPDSREQDVTWDWHRYGGWVVIGIMIGGPAVLCRAVCCVLCCVLCRTGYYVVLTRGSAAVLCCCCGCRLRCSCCHAVVGPPHVCKHVLLCCPASYAVLPCIAVLQWFRALVSASMSVQRRYVTDAVACSS